MSAPARRSLALFAVLAVSSSALADVIVVTADGSGQFTNLQMAVSAAADGDTLLVRAGAYSSFTIDAKSLTVTADVAALVSVNGSVVVKNLGAHQTVVLAGLSVKGATTLAMTDDPGVGLIASSNAGALRADGCTFEGAKGIGDGGWGSHPDDCTLPNHSWGWHGAKLDQNSGGVAFHACTLTGGRGANANINCDGGVGGPGGDGVASAGTRVALYDCTMIGGRGGDNGGYGGVGGAGARIQSSTAISAVVASGTSFQGGHGGDGYDYIFSHGGNGGDGLVVESNALAWELDDTLAGGGGGLACYGAFPQWAGLPGAAQSGAGSVFGFPGGKLTLSAATVAHEATPVLCTITGTPGEHVFLRISDAAVFRPIASGYGIVLAGHANPHEAQFVMDLGTMPASGPISCWLTFGDVASATQRFVQTYSIDAQGHLKLGSCAAIAVVDSSY